MPDSITRDVEPSSTTFFPISAEERKREAALRERFAQFWANAEGDMRSIYDAFVSASPATGDVVFDEVAHADAQGWWVRPAYARDNLSQAILYIHGGGYGLGSAKAYRGFVSQLVNRTQIPAFVLEYPLAPEATLPSAPDAALAAWDWLLSQGCKQVAIVGDSAGGGLTLVTLMALTETPRAVTPVAGVVFSPWVDLAFTGASMKDAAVVDPLIGYAYLQDCANKYLGTVDAFDPLASPLFGDMKNLPPLFIQVGTDERLLDDSKQFATRARQAGVAVQLDIWEAMHHVFQLDVAHLKSSRIAIDRAAHFLRQAFDQQ